jgi:hypothetical protein
MTQPPAIDPAQRKAQAQIMTGMGMVMIGGMFGGVLAVVLYLIGKREIAVWAVAIAGAVGVVGIALQVIGYMALRAARPRGGP